MNNYFNYDELTNVKQGKIKIDSSSIDTIEYTINALNIISVTVGTTGYCGGDSGHGGRTYLKLEDLGSTDLQVRVNNSGTFAETSSVEIRLGGDSELSTFIQGLEFALKVLKSQIEKQVT
jgi:hypothetical protein